MMFSARGVFFGILVSVFDPLKSRNLVQEKNDQREAIDDNLVEHLNPVESMILDCFSYLPNPDVCCENLVFFVLEK